MHLSISELSELTGQHRDAISRRLVDLPFQPGRKGAHLFESAEALALLYTEDSLAAARAKLALSQASLNAVREKEFRKRMIPVDEVRDVTDQIRDMTMRVLRAEKAAVPRAVIKRIADKFRAIPEKWKRIQGAK